MRKDWKEAWFLSAIFILCAAGLFFFAKDAAHVAGQIGFFLGLGIMIPSVKWALDA